jgi:predicted NodU family carbamoyl transferase
MRFIGYHGKHDVSIAIFNDSELEFYAQAERFFPRNKNHYHTPDPILNAFPDLLNGNYVTAITSLGEENYPTPKYDPSLIRYLKSPHHLFPDSKFNLVVDHHLAHAVSSWLYRPDDKERLFLAYDGCGYGIDPTQPNKASLVGVINKKGFYKIEDALPVPSSVPICTLLGHNSAGKAMGLAGYLPHIPPIEWDAKNVMKLLNVSYDWNSIVPCYIEFKNPNSNDMEFIAGFYKFLIEQIWVNIKENIEKFGSNRGVVVGGGTALALELNTRIYNMTQDLVFGPPINDSGLALGAAALAYFHVYKKWPKINSAAINALQTPLPQIGAQEPQEIAKLIARGKIVALMRGKSEAGPRALGFRSIFASAKAENLKIVSEGIKGREFYRPLAPVVTSEAFDQYFIGPKGEYMQYRCICTDMAKQYLPAIVHRDFSSRPQVVYKEKDPWLHELLVEYGKLTGHECFINTSLNRAGKPICNSYEDAQEDMQGKDVTFVVLK